MAITYEHAVSQLFQASHEHFVSERKRLSVELKAAGDKAGAARLTRLNRPPVSAWAVNQLWWQAQAGFEELVAAAARQRAGDRAAAGAHRQLLAELRARAGELLQAAGHAATETTLRRVTMTLAALAAAGDFAPDPPGALTADRDPPGFETVASAGEFEAAPKPVEAKPVEAKPVEAKPAEAKPAEQEEAEREQALRAENQRRKQAEEEQGRRLAAERARQAELQRLQGTVRDARAELDSRALAVARQRDALAVAEKALEKAQAALDAAAARLQAFEEPA